MYTSYIFLYDYFLANAYTKYTNSRKNTRDLLKHFGGSKESFARSYKIQKLKVS